MVTNKNTDTAAFSAGVPSSSGAPAQSDRPGTGKSIPRPLFPLLTAARFCAPEETPCFTNQTKPTRREATFGEDASQTDLLAWDATIESLKTEQRRLRSQY